MYCMKLEFNDTTILSCTQAYAAYDEAKKVSPSEHKLIQGKAVLHHR